MIDKENIRSIILNRILSLLLMQEQPSFNFISNDGKESKFIELKVITDLIPDYEIEQWMIKEFKKELLYKKYIQEDINRKIKITELGKEFIRKGGYRGLDKKENQEEKIREETIISFKYGKWSFFISVLALIISILALLSNK